VAIELCADELVVGGKVWVVLRPAARRAVFVGVGGVRPDERAQKQRTRFWTGVFSGLTGVITSPVMSAGPLAPKS